MLQQLINHNSDIKELFDKGYKLEVSGGQYLLVHQIPYVNSNREVKQGTIVCVLTLKSPTILGKPNNHTVFFIGETPCDYNGNPLSAIINNSNTKQLTQQITINHYFSSKPSSGQYSNYYDKINTYAMILSSNAEVIIKQAEKIKV